MTRRSKAVSAIPVRDCDRGRAPFIADGGASTAAARRPRGRRRRAKAAAAMAAVVQEHWRGPLEGLVTRYGHRARTNWIEFVEAGHPATDAACEVAATRIPQCVEVRILK